MYHEHKGRNQFHVQIFIGGVTKGITIAQREDNERNRRTIEIQFDSYSVLQSLFPREGSVSSKSLSSPQRGDAHKRETW